MMTLDDTQPNKPMRLQADEGSSGPPRILLIGVIGFFLLVVVGAIVAVIIFREVLEPGQQQRVIDQLPFMEAFKRPTPVGGILPTVAPQGNSDQNALDLLNMPLESATPVGGVVATSQPTQAATTAPTSAPTATLTTIPTATATQETANVPQMVAEVNAAATATSEPAASSQTFTVGQIIPPNGRIYGITHQKQTWNNCGPATLTMGLSFYGWREDQKYAASILKPNREDKNVGPDEMANFVNTQTGVRAIVRMGGDIELLKTLNTAQFPVIVEMAAMFEAYDWLGHYRLLVGYDDKSRSLYFYDSFQGVGEFEQGVGLDYNQFDADWQDFNRTFVVIYQQEREAELKTLLGARAEEHGAAEHAFKIAQDEARRNAQDGHAWFNMGSALVVLGRYQEAANAYDQARRFDLPWRMLWYQFGPFKAYFEVGRYDDILSLVQVNLNNAEELEETYYWRGRVYAAQGKSSEAAAEFRRALNYNPNFEPAKNALATMG
jgi:tetratricopeptide (TPR) repeat protein